MKKSSIFWLLTLFAVHTLKASNPKTIMLVLGSDKVDILNTRIQLAYKLYKSQNIDRIIVSGGCGAHASSICEATMMYDGLVSLGVANSLIYKEENSKSTVQNYVYSRELKDEFDQRIIQEKDTVIVVSDHWHAISVAARLRKYDGVEAKFFIEGDITPKIDDKLDYVSIFNGEQDNDVFIRKALWLTPKAAWHSNGANYYVMDSIIYVVEDGSDRVKDSMLLTSIFRELNPKIDATDWSFIDYGNSWLIKASDTMYRVDKLSFKVLKTFSWTKMVKDIPAHWLKNAFNAGFILNNKLVLFAQDAVFVANKVKNNFVFEWEGLASDLLQGWPFSWGKSNVAGVSFGKDKKSIFLYRNRETIEINESLNVIQQPVRLNVKWINNQ